MDRRDRAARRRLRVHLKDWWATRSRPCDTRRNAAGRINGEFNLYAFLFTIGNLYPQLERLYKDVRTLNLPNNEDIRTAHSVLLHAIESEYNFQKAALKLNDDPENLQVKAAFDEALKNTNDASELSTYSIVRLMIHIDDDFIQAYGKIVPQ